MNMLFEDLVVVFFEEFDPLRSGGGRPTAETQQQQHDRHQAHAAHGYMTADCRC